MWCARNQLLLLIVVFSINFNCYLSMTMHSCKKERKSYDPIVFFLTKIFTYYTQRQLLCLLMDLKDMYMTLDHRMISKTLFLRLVTSSWTPGWIVYFGAANITTVWPHLNSFCNNIRGSMHSGPFFFLFLRFDQIRSVELFLNCNIWDGVGFV